MPLPSLKLVFDVVCGMIVWPGVLVYTCNTGTWEVEARGSRVQSHP